METISFEFAEKLDKALAYFCKGNTDVNGKQWYTSIIHNKLIADGYVDIKRQQNLDIMEVVATERGHVFYANGGYTKQNKEEFLLNEERKARQEDRKDQKRNRWLTFAAIVVSAICALIQLYITTRNKL